MAEGKVYLVGAGPGDAQLFTLKGKAVLEAADVVVFDRLVGGGVLAMIPQKARKIDVGKNAGHHPVSQEEINDILLREAQAGHKVVRLKGGDPFVFGRGGEELELLVEHGIHFEVVPGITSALSAAAYAGIPVTHRDCCTSVHIITAHRRAGKEGDGIDYGAIAKAGGTLVFLMGVGEIPNICAGLFKGGMSAQTPAAIVERGTTARQRRICGTLSNLVQLAQSENVTSPAVVIVGEVTSLSDKFAWAEKLPLFGARVVVTRTRAQASRLSSLLREQGAEVLESPAIAIEPIESEDLTAALKRLHDYKVVVFTSTNGVDCFFNQLKQHRIDIRSLGNAKLAAIGGATRDALQERGLQVDILPDIYDAKHLGEQIAQSIQKGDKVLSLRAEEGSKELTEALHKAGVAFDDIAVYRTAVGIGDGLQIRAWAQEAAEGKAPLYAALGSASCARGFAAALSAGEKHAVTAVCIGEQTAAAAREQGLTNIVVAKKASIEELVKSVLEAHAAFK